jgi:trimethylamine monooxygenase
LVCKIKFGHLICLIHKLGKINFYFNINRVAKEFIIENFKVPDFDKITKNIKNWQKKEDNIKNISDLLNFQGDYIKELLSYSDYQNFDINGGIDIFIEWIENKQDNILTFRDKQHKSLITGKLSIKNNHKWSEIFEDSKEGFLKLLKE